MPSEGTEIVIRQAAPADAELLGAFATRLTAFALPPWRTADEIAVADRTAMIEAVLAGRGDEQVMIAERAGAPVGCLHVLAATDFFGRRHAHISVLAVTAAAEGTGVGRALIACAEDWARRRGLSLLTLNVFAANARARALYERTGFLPETLKYAKEL